MDDDKDKRLQELEAEAKELRAEVKELRMVLCDRLETVEGAIADASSQAKTARAGSKYNYQMLLAIAMLVAAVVFSFLPEKWQEAASAEKVSKRLEGFNQVLTLVLQITPVAGAGAIAYKAHNLKQRS